MKQKKQKKEQLIDILIHTKLFLIIPSAAILSTVLTLATFTIPSFGQSEGTNETMQNAGESANQTGENMQQGANKTGEAIQGNASGMGSKITEGAKNLAENIGEKLQDIAK